MSTFPEHTHPCFILFHTTSDPREAVVALGRSSSEMIKSALLLDSPAFWHKQQNSVVNMFKMPWSSDIFPKLQIMPSCFHLLTCSCWRLYSSTLKTKCWNWRLEITFWKLKSNRIQIGRLRFLIKIWKWSTSTRLPYIWPSFSATLRLMFMVTTMMTNKDDDGDDKISSDPGNYFEWFFHLAFHHQSLSTEEVVEEIFLPVENTKIQILPKISTTTFAIIAMQAYCHQSHISLKIHVLPSLPWAVLPVYGLLHLGDQHLNWTVGLNLVNNVFTISKNKALWSSWSS